MTHTKENVTPNWLTQTAVVDGWDGLKEYAQGESPQKYLRSCFVQLGNHSHLRVCEECSKQMKESDPSFSSVEEDGLPVCLHCGLEIIVARQLLDESHTARSMFFPAEGLIDIARKCHYQHPLHPLHGAWEILLAMCEDAITNTTP